MFKNQQGTKKISIDSDEYCDILRPIFEENWYIRLLESYISEEYDLVDYLVGEFYSISEKIEFKEFEEVIIQMNTKIQNFDYELDEELEILRKIINIMRKQYKR